MLINKEVLFVTALISLGLGVVLLSPLMLTFSILFFSLFAYEETEELKLKIKRLELELSKLKGGKKNGRTNNNK